MKAPHLEALAGDLASEGRHCEAAQDMLRLLVESFATGLAGRVQAGAGIPAADLPRMVEQFNLVVQYCGHTAFHQDRYRKAAGKVLRQARQVTKGAACSPKS